MLFFESGGYQLLIGIIGFFSLVISFVTFLKAISIDRKVKKALREKKDYEYFKKNCIEMVNNLKGIQKSLIVDKIFNDFISGRINRAIVLLEEHLYLLKHKHKGRIRINNSKIRKIIKRADLSAKQMVKLSNKLDLLIIIFDKGE